MDQILMARLDIGGAWTSSCFVHDNILTARMGDLAALTVEWFLMKCNRFIS